MLKKLLTHRFPDVGISYKAGLRIAIAFICIAGISGCTTSKGAERNVDPLEAINRPIYKFNSVTDKFILRPIAKGYDFVMPRLARVGVRNFLDNLRYPVVFVNGFLQGKFKQGASDTGRFLINSTVGLGGLFDPATSLGLVAHQEDFGLTFARWGIPQGPYIVVPMLGPRTVRSGVGTLADIQINPMVQLNNTSLRSKILILFTIDSRANLLPIDEQINAAYDPYLFIRDAYLQNRVFLLEDDSEATDDPFEDEFEEDF